MRGGGSICETRFVTGKKPSRNPARDFLEEIALKPKITSTIYEITGTVIM